MKRTIALLLAVAAVFTLTACGGQTPAANAGKGPLVLGTSADRIPFEFMYPDESGELVYGGIDISVAKFIADSMDRELQIENAAFDTLLDGLNRGEFDMVISAMDENEERLEIADFSVPYYTAYPPLILVRAADAAAYSSADAFMGKIVGVQGASDKEELAKAVLRGTMLFSYRSVDEMVDRLINQKLDAVVLDNADALAFADENEDLAVAELVLGKASPLRVAVAKGDPKGLLPGINSAVADMLSNDRIGEFAALAESLGDVAFEIPA